MRNQGQPTAQQHRDSAHEICPDVPNRIQSTPIEDNQSRQTTIICNASLPCCEDLHHERSSLKTRYQDEDHYASHQPSETELVPKQSAPRRCARTFLKHKYV